MLPKPTRNRVLIKKLKPEEQTYGTSGLLVTTTPQKNLGRVVDVGPGADSWDSSRGEFVTFPMKIQTGMKVLVPEHGMTPMTFEGEDYFMINEDQVLGVFPENDA